jgi:predicted RNA binding protein YcfA (HicA-like mRNA interferase family)
MGNFRPLQTKCWEKFLLFHKFQLSRIKGSHHQWTKNGFRTIPVWGDEKQIPPFHLKKGCETIGVSLDDLYKWAEVNC